MNYLLSHSILNSAMRHPERKAFQFNDKYYDYATFESHTAKLAAVLLEEGLKKGDRVGIFLNRCIESSLAIYGILRAGGVYVPIDPNAPLSRTAYLLQDCGIKILITNNVQRKKIAEIYIETKSAIVIGLDDTYLFKTIPWNNILNSSLDLKLPFRVLEKDVAYIMYTSGSTGKPKGIIHTHHSGLSYAKLSAKIYEISNKDVIGNHAPLHFDISTLGYLSGPYKGACTVISSDAHTMFPTSLAQMIVDQKISIWYSVPLAIIQMLQQNALTDKDCSALRWVLYGGEPFPLKYVRQLLSILPNSMISNVYGPAEVNQCSYYNFNSIPEECTDIPIGKIWDNTEYLILDDNGQNTKVGEVGELLIRSATQMQGYWNNPELTKSSLFESSSIDSLRCLFYKTGDLVMEDKNKLLHFKGRKDFQVKVRGYRVELSAVEAVLVRHEAVAEAAVFKSLDQEEVATIQSAVILHPGSTANSAELKLFLKSQLPHYAIPESIWIVKDLPRTTSGKIKRNQLYQKLMNKEV